MDLIEQMQKAIAQTEQATPPMREFRLHPDDLKALRKQCVSDAPACSQFNARHDRFEGVRIIEDEAAPRLPLKAT